MTPRKVGAEEAQPAAPVDPAAPIHVVGVEVRNFHRLEVAQVEHVPGQGLVRVTGLNRQGKTSLLKAVAACLGGAAEVRRSPVRVHAVEVPGEEPMGIEEGGSITRLHLSNGFRLTRTYTEAMPKGYLVVQGPDGGRHGQAKLDGWLGPLAFDPLGFYGLKADRQREVLLAMGTDPDLPAKLEANRAARAAVYEERTPWIAQQRAAVRITQPPGERPTPVDTRAELARMGELQALERQRSDLLREHDREVEVARRRADDKRREAASMVEGAHADLDELNEDLRVHRERVADLERRLAEQRDAVALVGQRVQEQEQVVVRLTQELEQLPEPDEVPLPPPPMLPADPTAAMDAVRRRLEEAEAVQEALKPWQRWDEAKASRDEAFAHVERLTAQHEALVQQERDLVAAAGIPVPGLTFGEGGEPLLNGLPLEVASGAERIQLAVQVAIQADPQLRIALVDEANDMDLESLAELDRLARAHDFQVWACRLGLEGAGEVVVHDGEAYANPNEPVALPALPS